MEAGILDRESRLVFEREEAEEDNYFWTG